MLYHSDGSTVANNTCYNNGMGLVLYETSSLVVTNNTCSNNIENGIHFHESDNSTVVNNTCSYNPNFGISIQESERLIVTNNTCSNNTIGMSLNNNDFSVFTYNLLQENEIYGLWFYPLSNNNLIHHNNFVDNNLGGTSQADDRGTNNCWYDSSINEGNYWSDWSGTGSYAIGGVAGAIDPYPLDYSPFKPLLTPHDSISITSDIGFADFPGSGTAEDPYLIEGYNITTTNSIGIHIADTTKYFTIRYCYVDATDYGIYIDTVAVGTATIANNTCSNNNYGIFLIYSSFSTVSDNTYSNNDWSGIELSYSDYCVVTYNLLEENENYGVYLYPFSDNNLIHHNNFVDNNLGGISQANDDGVNNYWYDSSINEGNYWSDWSGTGSYAIDGSAGAIDSYPFDDSPADPLLTPHDPISITSDIGFADFPGSGTAGDPYLIEGYNITTTDSIGIYIADTTKYFTIRNCYVAATDYGIYIDTVAAGTAIVISATCTNNNLRGIYIYESSSSTITNNICSNNGEYGIYLGDSVSSTVVGNTCNNNNLYGIYIDSSGSSTVSNNLCSYNNYGLLFYWSVNSDVTHNMCINNDVDGIYLYASTSSTVSNNTCSYNNGDGIFLEYSGLSTVIYNICNNNTNRGIFLYDSACDVTYNILYKNVGYGVYLSGSDDDFVHHNDFIDNNLGGTSQAYDDGSNHLWYDTVSLEGNYWSDWSGTGTYAIDGSAGSVDLYPFGEPTMFLGPPVFVTIIHSPSTPTELDTISVSATVTSLHGVQSVALHYRVNSGTWIEVSMTLVIGDVYAVTIGSFVASDTIEYYLSAIDDSVDNNEVIADNEGLYYTILVGSSDVTGPSITGVIHSPSTPIELDAISINATVTDSSGVQSVTLHYRVNGGTWIEVSMTLVSGDLYSVTIGSFAVSDTIEYYLTAVDNSINHNAATEDNSGLYYSFAVYSTIPEFQTFSLFLPAMTFLFLVFSLAVLQRRKK